MKKVLLVACFAFSFTVAKAGYSVKTDSSELAGIVDDTSGETVLPVCFGLSCGTWCDPNPDASDYWFTQDIECVFNDLENICCGEGCGPDEGYSCSNP